MKICFVNLLYSKPRDRGGVGAHITTLSSALSRRGHDVTIVTAGRGQQHLQHGVKVVCLGEVDRYSNPRQLCNPMFLFRRISYMIRLTRYVWSQNFDVAEFADGGLEQLFLALLRNCALVTKLHGNFRFAFSHGKKLSACIERVEASVVIRSDRIYGSTSNYAQQISNAYRIPPEKIALIPCGIDTAKVLHFPTEDLTRAYPEIQGKRLALLNAGNSARRKGAHLFLETARRLRRRDVFYVLFCDDTQFLATADVPDNVKLQGSLDHDGFYKWMAASDIVVVPSTTESFSITMHEAMLFRKTIVVSPFVPLEAIDQQYPRAVRLETLDADALTNALADVLDGRKVFLEQRGDTYQQFSEYYDIERVVALTEKLYAESMVVGPCGRGFSGPAVKMLSWRRSPRKGTTINQGTQPP